MSPASAWTPRRMLMAFGLLGVAAFSSLGIANAAGHLVGHGLAFPELAPGYGQSLELVGHLDLELTQMPFDLQGEWNEYTWTLTGPVVYELVEPSPGIHYRKFTFGVLEIREDSSRNSAFLPNPPNAAVPSSFHDGDVVLLGTVTGLEVRDIFGIVTATAELHFEGGGRLAELETQNWAFNAAISGFGDAVPLGYGARWTLGLLSNDPVAVESGSWSAIKALYR